MKQTKILMDMPITVEIVDKSVTENIFDKVFEYLKTVDDKFSTYKKNSEISLINAGIVKKKNFSQDMKEVFQLSQQTKKETDGFFDIYRRGKYDPSGIVKGWAIYNASLIIKRHGFKNFYVDAGGDIQVSGRNKNNDAWKIGIKNPFNQDEIVQVVYILDEGLATSGTYIRGNHIYNPKDNRKENDIISLTVIGPNVYEADRFATAAFAMGKNGILFLERLPGFEGYMIDKSGIATYTSKFKNYTN